MLTCFWHFYKTDQEVPEPEKESQAFFMKGDRGQPNRATPVLLNVSAAQESGTDPPGSSSPGPWCIFGGGEGKAYTVFWGHLLAYDSFSSPCNRVTLIIEQGLLLGTVAPPAVHGAPGGGWHCDPYMPPP